MIQLWFRKIGYHPESIVIYAVILLHATVLGIYILLKYFTNSNWQ